MAVGIALKLQPEQISKVLQVNQQQHQQSQPPLTLKAFTSQQDEFPPLTMPTPIQTSKLSFVEAVKSHQICPETSGSAHARTLSDFAAEKIDPDSVHLLPISEHQGKPAVFFPIAHKEILVDKLKLVLVGKFSHGRPIWNNVKKFFNDLKLKGEYKVSVFDNKHIFIVCSCKTDFDRLWLNFSWSVDGIPMRVFKWGPEFSPLKESSIQPIWIRMVGLPLHLIDEMSLLQISHIVGKPIKVDPRNINQTMLNQARVCVQLDVNKPLLHSCWIGFKNESGDIVESHFVQVFYDFVPAYCSYCAHVGHKTEGCKRKLTADVQSDVIEQVSAVLDVDKTPEIVHQRPGKEHSKNLVWQPVIRKNKELQPYVEQRRATGASSSNQSTDITVRNEAAQVVQVRDGAPSSAKITDFSAQEAAEQGRNEAALTNAPDQNSFCTDCPAHEVPTEAKSSETSTAREDNLAVVNIAENAESSKSTDLPSYKTVLQLEGANSIEVEPPLKASNQEQTTPIASKQQCYSELTKDAAIEVVSKIANKETLAAKKLVLDGVDGNISAGLAVQESSLEHAADGPQVQVCNSEEEWTMVVNSKKKGKRQNANQIPKEHKEQTMEMELVHDPIQKQGLDAPENTNKDNHQSAKLNKFRNLKYCDELDKSKRNRFRRSSSVPPQKVNHIKALVDCNVKSDLPIDFDQIFIDQDEKEHSWDDIRSKHLVASSRSVSPSGRTSSKLSSLKKKIELLYYLEDKAWLWDKASYEESRIKRTSKTSSKRPNPKAPTHKGHHSQSAPQASRRGRKRNKDHNLRKHGKGPF